MRMALIIEPRVSRVTLKDPWLMFLKCRSSVVRNLRYTGTCFQTLKVIRIGANDKREPGMPTRKTTNQRLVEWSLKEG